MQWNFCGIKGEVVPTMGMCALDCVCSEHLWFLLGEKSAFIQNKQEYQLELLTVCYLSKLISQYVLAKISDTNNMQFKKLK
jgi:hypothetical protein